MASICVVDANELAFGEGIIKTLWISKCVWYYFISKISAVVSKKLKTNHVFLKIFLSAEMFLLQGLQSIEAHQKFTVVVAAIQIILKVFLKHFCWNVQELSRLNEEVQTTWFLVKRNP